MHFTFQKIVTKPYNFDQQGIEQDAFSKYLCPSSDEEYCETQTEDFDDKATGKMGQSAVVIASRTVSKNKGGKFLKKLWCCVGGSITR